MSISEDSTPSHDTRAQGEQDVQTEVSFLMTHAEQQEELAGDEATEGDANNSRLDSTGLETALL